MDPSDFFTGCGILIVAGKGGVGKTTVSAALGVAASQLGLNTLLVEIEGKRGLATLFAEPGLVYDDTELIASKEGPNPVGQLRARTIRANDALVDYFHEHGLKRFGAALTKVGVLDTLATSTPGLKDLIVMGKIKQLEAASDADVIIVDAPASGHAISFLRSAKGLQDTIDTGPIRRQADEVVALLTDPKRSQVVLVTLPEETPVNELIETAYALEDEVGVRLGPVVANAVYPKRPLVEDDPPLDHELTDAVAAATQFWDRREADQHQQLDRLSSELPLHQLVVTKRLTTSLDESDIHAMADELINQLKNAPDLA